MFQSTLEQTTWEMGRNTVAIRTAAALQYLLINVKVITLEKVSFSDVQTRKTVS